MKITNYYQQVCLLLFLAFLSGPVFSQNHVQIKLLQPPSNQLRMTDLWKLNIFNPSRSTLEVTLYGTLEEAGAGIVVEGTSKSIKLPPGNKMITYNNVKTGRVKFISGKWREAFTRTGNAPSGDYTICAYIKEKSGEEIASDCIKQIIEIASPPTLISPSNGATIQGNQYPTFTWLPPMPAPTAINYKLRIVEVLSGQTPETAMRRNYVWFEKNDISATSFQYPIMAKKLEKGMKYAWTVQAINKEGNPIGGNNGTSEISNFLFSNDIDIQIDSVNISCCKNGQLNFSITVTNNLSNTVKITQLKIDKVNGISNSPVISNLLPVLPANINGSQSQEFTGSIDCIDAAKIIRFYVAAEDINDNAITETEVEADTLLCSCCDGFIRELNRLSITAVNITNELVQLSDNLVAGPEAITRVTAELVYLSVFANDTNCIKCNYNSLNFGNITEGSLVGFGAGTITYPDGLPQYSREITWESNSSSGVDMTSGRHLDLSLSLPRSKALSCCSDTIRFCIRFSFTDTSCTTCDTVICKTFIRTASGIIMLSGNDSKSSFKVFNIMQITDNNLNENKTNKSTITDVCKSGEGSKGNHNNIFLCTALLPLIISLRKRNFKMKKAITRTSSLIKIIPLCLIIFLLNNKLNAQSCNQVEIIYETPGCFDKEGYPEQNNNAPECEEISACVNQPCNYSATGSSWSTYNWDVTGPASLNFSTSTIQIEWPLTGTYTLTLTVTNGAGNEFTKCLTVEVYDKPSADFTFSPNNICAGSTIYFNPLYPDDAVYSWDFGDPASGSDNFSSAKNPTHTYNSVGTYQVTLVAYSFILVPPWDAPGEYKDSLVQKVCCADTFVQTVTIEPGDIQIECISTVCPEDVVTYTAVNCLSPIWEPPIGGTVLNQSGNQITIQWGDGSTQGVIQAHCDDGCLASVPVPIIPSNPVPMGNLTPCSGSITSYTLPSLPGTYYKWHLYKGTQDCYFALDYRPDYNTVWIDWSLLSPGNYILTVNLENKHICCDNSSGTININLREKFYAGNDQTICTGDPANLFVSPSAGTFNWSVTPTAGVVPYAGSGGSFAPVFNSSGTYIVTVTESSGTYCNDTEQLTITVLEKPVISNIDGPEAVCLNSLYTYSMSNDAPSGYFYSWNVTPAGSGTFQPGSLSNVSGNTATINWTTLPATISVTLQRNSSPPCPQTVTLAVEKAVIDGISGSSITCVDGEETYSLSGTLPAEEIVTWSVSPPKLGTILSGQGTSSIVIHWFGSDVNTAVITASSGCGSATKTVTINSPLIGTIDHTGSDFCTDFELSTASGSNHNWFLNGTPIGNTNPISITQGGFYVVTYTDDNNCNVTATSYIPDDIACNLLITTTDPTLYCTGQSISTELSAAMSTGCLVDDYRWYRNGALISGATSLTYTAITTGHYYAKATKGSCSYTSNTIKIIQKDCGSGDPGVGVCAIVPDFVFNIHCRSVIFDNLTMVFPGSGGTTSWSWNFDDPASGANNVSSDENPTHVFSGPGTYSVALTATYSTPDLDCTESITYNVEITAPNSPPIDIDVPICAGHPASFSTTLNGMFTYHWDFGDNSYSNRQNVSHTYSTPGSYTVTLTVMDFYGCTADSTFDIDVLTGFNDCFLEPIFICPGGSETLTAPTGTGYHYQWEKWDWSTNSYTIIGSDNHQLSVSDSGQYHVVITNANGCICTSNLVEVRMLEKPAANIEVLPSTHLCDFSDITLNSVNARNNYYYEWYADGALIGSGGSLSQINISNVNVTTTYTLVITNEYGCKDTCDIIVYVNTSPDPPIITTNPSGILCEGTPVQLTVINYTDNIMWNTGEHNDTISVFLSGIYTATYTDSNGCSSSSSVFVYSRPSTELYPHFCDSIQCCAWPFSIYAPQSALDYAIDWFNSANVNIGNGPVYTPPPGSTDSYYIVVTDLTSGCTDTSETYSIVVPNCECSCDNSFWGEIVIEIPGPISDGKRLECGGRYSLECNQPYNINASYNCNQDSCNRNVSYELINPSGFVANGNLPNIFTFTQSGLYTLILSGWCGDVLCDTCSIRFVVDCPEGSCCDNFETRVNTLQFGHLNNNPGTYILNPELTAGPNKIIKVSATLEYVAITYNHEDCEQCVQQSRQFGNFISAGYIGPWSPSMTYHPDAAPSSKYSREIIWGDNSGTTSTDMTAGISTLLWISLPPKVPQSLDSCCVQTINFCIRYKFTDSTCVTCDTLVCYQYSHTQEFNWKNYKQAGQMRDDNDPLIELYKARDAAGKSGLKASIEKWYSEIKKTDGISRMINNHPDEIKAVLDIVRKLTAKGETLLYSDLKIIEKAMEIANKEITPAPPGLIEDTMKRLDSSVGKRWEQIIEDFEK